MWSFSNYLGEFSLSVPHETRSMERAERYGFYEPFPSRLLTYSLRPTDVFYDVGARFGYYTVLAEAIGAEAHAFDPNSNKVPYLEENIEGTANQAHVPDDVGLDEYADEHARPSVLKVDVEGSELAVLESGPRTVAAVRECYVEVHAEGDTPAVIRHLKEAGLTPLVATGDHRHPRKGLRLERAAESDYGETMVLAVR